MCLATDPEGLIENARAIITGMQTEGEFIRAVGLTTEGASGEGLLEKSWYRLCSNLVMQDEAILEYIVAFHVQLSSRVVGHVEGVCFDLLGRA